MLQGASIWEGEATVQGSRVTLVISRRLALPIRVEHSAQLLGERRNLPVSLLDQFIGVVHIKSQKY